MQLTIMRETIFQLDARGRINKRGRSKKVKIKTIQLPSADEDGMLYQTVVIGGQYGGSTWRYYTKKWAIGGHAKAVLFIETMHEGETT